MSLQDLLPYRLPSMPEIENGNRIVCFSVPPEVFHLVEEELKSVESVYQWMAKRWKERAKMDGSPV